MASFEERLKTLEGKLVHRMDRVERKNSATEKKVDQLAVDVKANRVLDVFAFADHSERADFASNLLKVNSVLVTGMLTPTEDACNLKLSFTSYFLFTKV